MANGDGSCIFEEGLAGLFVKQAPLLSEVAAGPLRGVAALHRLARDRLAVFLPDCLDDNRGRVETA